MFIYKGAFYAEASPQRIQNILDLVNIKKGQKVVDLGSGDGRLVVEFAKKGAFITGYEINPWLVHFSKLKIKKLGLQKNAKILFKSFWKSDLSKYDVIVIYGVSYMMADLQKKIEEEINPGTKIVSVYFKFPDLEVKRKLGEVYLY